MNLLDLMCVLYVLCDRVVIDGIFFEDMMIHNEEERNV
jgi:hypothetical protein